MTTATDEILSRFVAEEDGRYKLTHPFVLNGRLYALDGYACIRRTTDEPDTEMEKPRPPVEELKWDRSLYHDEATTFNASGIDAMTPCKHCGGAGMVSHVECEECCGMGEIECCECGQDTECPECSGTGKIEKNGGEPSECGDCSGGFRRNESLVGGIRIRSYHAKVIAEAGGSIYLNRNRDHKVAYFTLPGGYEGLVVRVVS